MMDEMKFKLSTRFFKSLLAKFISKSIKKKYGYKVDIRINEINLEMFNGDTDLHLDVDVKMNGNEFKQLMESIVED